MTNGLFRSVRCLLLPLTLAAAAPAAASELNVERWHWNLDNTARPAQFNTLLLSVTNVSPEPFDGELTLFDADGAAPIRQPVYLPPGQRQRVFFDAFVNDSSDRFLVRWGRRANQRIEIGSPTLRTVSDGTTVVAIDDGRTLAPKQSGVSMLAAEDFPPSAATLPVGGLVLLDHMPRWQTAQQQTLLDWVRLGGEVRTLQRADTAPQFSGELAIFGSPAAEADGGMPLGAGRIIAVPLNLAQMPADEFKAMTRVAKPQAEAIAPNANVNVINPNDYGGHYTPDFSPSESFFSSLSYLHRPDVNWSLIFTLFGAYIVVLIGGGLLVSRKTRSWQKTYLTLLGTVAAFSVLFWQIGARGHGEQSLLTTIAMADVLDDDRVRISAWSDVFTPRSRDIVLKPGSGRAGLRPRENAGTLVGGTDPMLARSAPPFSSVTFEWQAIESLPVPKLSDVTRDGDRVTFRLTGVPIRSAYYVTSYRTRIRRGPAKGNPPVRPPSRRVDVVPEDGSDGLRFSRCSPAGEDRYFITPILTGEANAMFNTDFKSVQYRSQSERSTRSEMLDLAQGDLNLLAARGKLRRPLPPERVDLLIFTDLPQPFVEGLSDAVEAADGRLVYRVPLWLSDIDETDNETDSEISDKTDD